MKNKYYWRLGFISNRKETYEKIRKLSLVNFKNVEILNLDDENDEEKAAEIESNYKEINLDKAKEIDKVIGEKNKDRSHKESSTSEKKQVKEGLLSFSECFNKHS